MLIGSDKMWGSKKSSKDDLQISIGPIVRPVNEEEEAAKKAVPLAIKNVAKELKSMGTLWKFTEILLFGIAGMLVLYYPRLGLLRLIANILEDYYPMDFQHFIEQATIWLIFLLSIAIHTNTINRHLEIILMEKRSVESGMTDFLFQKVFTGGEIVDIRLIKEKWYNHLYATMETRVRESAFVLIMNFLFVFNISVFCAILVLLVMPILQLVFKVNMNFKFH
jgi:hypothetical protein